MFVLYFAIGMHLHAFCTLFFSFFFLFRSVTIYLSFNIYSGPWWMYFCVFPCYHIRCFTVLYLNRSRCVFISFPYIFSNKILCFFFLLISFVHSHAIKYRYVIWAMNIEYEWVCWTSSVFFYQMHSNKWFLWIFHGQNRIVWVNECIYYVCVCFAWANVWRRLHMEILNSI